MFVFPNHQNQTHEKNIYLTYGSYNNSCNFFNQL